MPGQEPRPPDVLPTPPPSPFDQAQQRATRETFGLGTDADALAQAQAETTKRFARGDTRWWGAPMTDAELAAFTAVEAALEKLLPPLQSTLDAHADVTAGYTIDRGPSPAVRVQVTDRASDVVISELRKLATDDLSVVVETVALSANDIRARVKVIQSQWDAWTAGDTSEGNLFAALAAAGQTPVDFSWGLGQQSVAVVVQADRLDPPTAERTITEVIGRSDATTADALRTVVTKGGEAVQPDADRTDAPGQVKGGLRIDLPENACTTGMVAFDFSGVYLMTAGHCTLDIHIDGRGVLAGQDVGAIKYRRDSGSVDATLVRLDLGGNASEYTMWRSGAYTGYEPLTATWTYADPPGEHYALCLEGASSLRAPDMTTYCGESRGTRNSRGLWETTLTSCDGDSGGLVRNGTTAFGLDHGHGGSGCGSGMVFSPMSAILPWFSVIPFIRSSPSTPRNGTMVSVDPPSDKCVDAVNGSFADPTNVQQWTCSLQGTSPQVWSLVPDNVDGSGDWWQFRRGGTKCLDVAGSVWWNPAQVVQYHCYGTANQIWRIARRSFGSNNFALSPRHDPTACLDVPGYSTSDGALLQTWDCTGVWNQTWRIR